MTMTLFLHIIFTSNLPNIILTARPPGVQVEQRGETARCDLSGGHNVAVRHHVFSFVLLQYTVLYPKQCSLDKFFVTPPACSFVIVTLEFIFRTHVNNLLGRRRSIDWLHHRPIRFVVFLLRDVPVWCSGQKLQKLPTLPSDAAICSLLRFV
jgi:hypothetical protein